MCPPIRCLLASACLLFSSAALAEDLADVAQSEAAAFVPIDGEELKAARAEVVGSAEKLEKAIGRLADKGAGWRSYLKWDAVETLTKSDAAPDLPALRKTLERLESGATGLELPAFRGVADKLARYVAMATLAGSKDQKAAFGRQLVGIAKLLDQDPALQDPRLGYQLERRLALLSDLGRSPEFLAAVRQAYNQNNLLVTVSEATLDKLIRREVATSNSVQDSILGARVVGTGDTRATISADLKPSTDGARIDFRLVGNVSTSTTSYKGPVAVRSTADSPISAVKTVRLTPEAFYIQPASANATTRSRTESIRRVGGSGFGSGLVQRIASRQVAEDRPRADRIASQRTASRVSASMNVQVEKAARGLRRRFDENWTKALARYGAAPDRFNLASTDETMDAFLLQASGGQLGAGTPAPAAPTGDLVGRLHVSALQNMATSVLGGVTLSKSAVDKPLKFSSQLPPWLDRVLKQETVDEEPAAGFKPWSVTLRETRPLSIRVNQDGIRIVIHTAAISTGPDAYTGWDILLAYKPELVDGQWRLTRQGQADVLPAGFDPAAGKQLRGRQVALRRNLARAINDGLNKASGGEGVITLRPIDLSDVESGGVSTIAIRDLLLGDGWVTVVADAL